MVTLSAFRTNKQKAGTYTHVLLDVMFSFSTSIIGPVGERDSKDAHHQECGEANARLPRASRGTTDPRAGAFRVPLYAGIDWKYIAKRE